MTDAQLRLVAHLTRIMRDEPEERERRWRENADLVARYASQGELLLAREWTADLVLNRNGVVIVKDTENGRPDSPGTETEVRLALFAAIEMYPELLSLLPERPVGASTCTSCEGTGILEMALTNPTLRNVRCECFGSGWIPPARTGV